MPIIADVMVRPPNSVLLIGDPVAEPPPTMENAVVARSRSVLAIGTTAESDGKTRIRVATAPDDATERPALAVFDGRLEVPGKRLVVSSVLGERYLDHSSEGGSQRVRIWIDHEREPQDVYILIG